MFLISFTSHPLFSVNGCMVKWLINCLLFTFIDLSLRFVSFRSLFCCFERVRIIIRIYSFVIQQFARLSAHDGAAPLSCVVCYGFVVSQLVIKPFAARLSAYTSFNSRPAFISFLTSFAFISRSMNSKFIQSAVTRDSIPMATLSFSQLISLVSREPCFVESSLSIYGGEVVTSLLTLQPILIIV